MTRRAFLKNTAMAGAAVGSVGFPSVLRNAHAAPTVLKFGTYEPAQAFNPTATWIPWMDKVNKAGEGVVKIDFFPGGVLNPDTQQQVKMIVEGAADITVTSLNWAPGRFPQANVVNTPMYARNMLEATYAVFHMYQKGIFSGFEDLYPLSMNAQPQYNFHTTFPARVPKDFDGRKIASGSRLQGELVRAAGATPVAEGIAKMAENISRRVYDGSTSEWNGLQSFRIIDVTFHHLMKVNLGANVFPILINKKKLDSIPSAARDILLEHSGWQLAEFSARNWDGYNSEIEARIRADSKHTVVDPTDEELELWSASFKPAVDAWMATQPQNVEVAALYKELLGEAREKGYS